MDQNYFPKIGRVVHYVLADYDLPPGYETRAGLHRPAIIVEPWGNDKQEPREQGSCVNLAVFTDARNDGLELLIWKTSVLHSTDCRHGSWHWPERK